MVQSLGLQEDRLFADHAVGSHCVRYQLDVNIDGDRVRAFGRGFNREG